MEKKMIKKIFIILIVVGFFVCFVLAEFIGKYLFLPILFSVVFYILLNNSKAKDS